MAVSGSTSSFRDVSDDAAMTTDSNRTHTRRHAIMALMAIVLLLCEGSAEMFSAFNKQLKMA
jgi:hypothetical protein